MTVTTPSLTSPPTPSAADCDVWNTQVERACAQACAAIAPAWPLDRAIAVNPHWSRVGLPLRRVAARMAVLGGIQVFPPRDRQREAWASGRIAPSDLHEALALCPEAAAQAGTPARCVEALAAPPAVQPLPLLIDALDTGPGQRTHLPWRQAVTHQVSQTCAAYFDELQADWQPQRGAGLYAFWRDTLQHDHGIGVLMGLPRLRDALRALPPSPAEAERWVLARLGLPPAVWADYLEAVLLTVNGWASWCAYRAWQARLQGGDDRTLRDLLAIRLAWGALLLEAAGTGSTREALGAVQRAWSGADGTLAAAERELCVDEIWQRALELGYQRELAQRLQSAPGPAPAAQARPEVQAAFCIDVRSEPLRRALEAAWPGVQTLGFAGFFGLPVAYSPLGTDLQRPQLPGLLPAALRVDDALVPGAGHPTAALPAVHDVLQSRRSRLSTSERWHAASRWPGTAFSFVEAAGLGYAGALARWWRPGKAARARDDLAGLPARYRPVCRPRLAGVGLDEQAALAERVLHAMGLTQGWAPLVLLVGHGSQSANNAHAAALDCGACCGQTGEVNARTLAAVLNEPAVRERLRARGLALPDDTVFMAALHNTTTDEIEPFDLDLLPVPARARWQRLRPVLAQAGDQVRRERAPSLGLDPREPHDRLLNRLRQRANDGAETRPEWGLAGNAAFVIAPRHRSAGAVLGGRVFLHDYDAAQDPSGQVLELLMTAPMLVTHWINWQYHASTCEPARLGSGNKVLHNVVGGTLGVFEGNGGDLRIGLSQQSLHDGTRWVHEPLRLTVVIDAPEAAIEAVIAKHAIVAQLVDHGWLHLWRFSPEGLQRRERGAWQAVP